MKITKRQLKKIIREALSKEVPELTGGRKSSWQVRKEKELAAKKKEKKDLIDEWETIVTWNPKKSKGKK